MIRKVRALRSDIWSLQLDRQLVFGEVVEMDVDLVNPAAFDQGMLEMVPDDTELGAPEPEPEEEPEPEPEPEPYVEETEEEI